MRIDRVSLGWHPFSANVEVGGWVGRSQTVVCYWWVGAAKLEDGKMEFQE